MTRSGGQLMPSSPGLRGFEVAPVGIQMPIQVGKSMPDRVGLVPGELVRA